MLLLANDELFVLDQNTRFSSVFLLRHELVEVPRYSLVLHVHVPSYVGTT